MRMRPTNGLQKSCTVVVEVPAPGFAFQIPETAMCAGAAPSTGDGIAGAMGLFLLPTQPSYYGHRGGVDSSGGDLKSKQPIEVPLSLAPHRRRVVNRNLQLRTAHPGERCQHRAG